MFWRTLFACAALFVQFVFEPSCRAEVFRVATFNVENYLEDATAGRPRKSRESKVKVVECITALRPDVIALQEMGSPQALEELQRSLHSAGLDLSHMEHVSGYDTNIFVAVLSRFPIVARRSHTNENFLLSGRRFRVSRGFAEVDIRVTENYTFTLMTAHLKSKRPVPYADESEMRVEEARLLREKIDARLKADPKVNLVVLGDFNDTKDASSTRLIIGRGKTKLLDTRPAERNGDNLPRPTPDTDPRNVTWTHFYAKEDTYSRIDYLLLSPGIVTEWLPGETYVQMIPNWGLASDHRPLVAAFDTEAR